MGLAMCTYALPYAIQCAQLAARRESVAVRTRMKGRITDLASIAATASFVGFLGTVVGLLNSFPSYGSSRSVILADETRRMSEAMIPGAIGLVVALVAFWSYRYLSDRLRAFELEMENTTTDLINRLTVYLALHEFFWSAGRVSNLRRQIRIEGCPARE